MENGFEPFTLYVGVTGHRDIAPEHIMALESDVARLFLELRSQYPDCSITVLSPLADGADRICARAALETGCRLIVPLPMEPGDYKNDFDEASSLEFDELCEKAARAFTVPMLEAKPQNTQRGYYYRQAGRYVAERSHMLVALWDGKETLYPEGGGTFETIQFARNQNCPVHVIRTPEQGKAFIPDKTAIRPDKCLSVLNGFYADIAANEAKITETAAENKACFVDTQTQQTLSPGATRIVNTFLYADALSLKYRNLKLLSLRLLSLFGLLLVMSFLLYDEMESDFMLLVYAVLIAVSVVVYLISSKKGFHQKYLRYRAIAEALRVQFYWSMCGITDHACDCYAFTHQTALGFTGSVLLSLQEDFEDFEPVLPQKAKQLWIQGQLSYHSASDEKKFRQDAFHKRAAKTMLTLSLVLFILTAGMELFFKEALEAQLPLNTVRGFLLMHDGQVVWRGILKIVLGTVSAGTAFLANYYGGLALQQQIFDNRRMKALFDSALSADPEDVEKFTSVMRGVGKEAMVECGGWYVAQRENAPGLFIG